MASPTSVSTDVVQRLYLEFRRQTATNLPAPTVKPPQAALEPLHSMDLHFEDLPPTLQHAILWESGFASLADGSTRPFRTSCGLTTDDGLSFSTVPLLTCALPSPNSASLIVWLMFSSQSPLPAPFTSATLAQERLFDGVVVPCSASHSPSLCFPVHSTTMKMWLLDYAATRTGPTMNLTHEDYSTVGAPLAVLPIMESKVQTDILAQTIRQDTIPSNSASNKSTAVASVGYGLLSDLTSLFYSLHMDGTSVSRLDLVGSVPLDVQLRLAASHLKFASLSGLLQRAILWDSGYALVEHAESSSRVDVAPIYVKCGLRMADLAPDRSYFESTGCPVIDCSQFNQSSGGMVYSFRAQLCSEYSESRNANSMASISRCAVPSQVPNSLSIPIASTSTLWAVGNISVGSRSTIPHLWLKRTPTSSITNNLFAIHSATDEGSSGACPISPSFIIPCTMFDQLNTQQEWCRPIQSEIISTWLRQEQHQEMALATLILMAGAILVALALDLFADRKLRFFANGRVSVSIPSLTSTVLDGGGDQSQSQSMHSDRTGVSSLRSARSVQSYR